MSAPTVLPEVPVKHADFISYATTNQDKPLTDVLEPFKKYDAKLREVFAQEPDHPSLANHYLNLVPVFNGSEKDVKIRARDPKSESEEERERYIIPLDAESRRPSGSSAIVESLKDFQQNFALFCESSLVDLNWNNVVAAGSSVTTSLLPVPEKYKKSKKALRQYYHEIVAPASDVDLFIYGLNEEEAKKKILEIEQRIKDSILTETTTIRTKNAITIASHYPTRHIQIVLRIYKSVSEILTGFDVDCSCAAYDGKQVYAAPRALTAFMTQINTIDLSRRSPSYESRLSKYSHRGFEIYWPGLERSRIDPTIFERNFARTMGLARLLVLERLPSKSEREAYMDERRRERGRPEINRFRDFTMKGDIKSRWEDEVPEWVSQEDVSDYHTFTIPYGPKYNAKKIEKLLYTKDLLLNAEWNKRDDREVNLHRHPAFFGYGEDVIQDCCGHCPVPVTPEEKDVAEQEAKIYVSGDITFIKDDPGRQAIGSFNPITDSDWTEMAYVGNNERLCRAIIDKDLEHVQDWLAQEGVDPNGRDYTGRTPLHLAVTSSSPEVVKTLIDAGARLVARLADGRTALHLAAARGNVEMVKMILQKSEENEEEEAKKQEHRKKAGTEAKESTQKTNEELDVALEGADPDNEDSDVDILEEEDSDDEMKSTTTGSYVKVKKDEKKEDPVPDDDNEDDPDVYDVNVLAWDTQCSPLHLAILNGHTEVVKELVQTFGADVLLPVKLIHSHDRSPRGALLTLVLAMSLPLEQAKAMTKTLLELGASCAQADIKQTTALHIISATKPELLETLLEHDGPAAKQAINHLSVSGSAWSPSSQSPLMSAINKENALAALKLLGAGAKPHIDSEDWIKSVQRQFDDLNFHRDSKALRQTFARDVEQPIVLAVECELPGVVLDLLNRGVDPNTLTKVTQQGMMDEYSSRYNSMETVLDSVRRKIKNLRSHEEQVPYSFPVAKEPRVNNEAHYRELIDAEERGTYKHFALTSQLEYALFEDKRDGSVVKSSVNVAEEWKKGIAHKKSAIEALALQFEEVEIALLAKEAKTFKELHPKIDTYPQQGRANYRHQPNNPKPLVLSFDFTVPDFTDETRERYLTIFQAAWDGDLETIKKHTLRPWQAESGEKPPLAVAIQDKRHQTPFSLAVLRGHIDCARGILEIAYAQYQPPEKKVEKARYRLGREPDEDDSDHSDDEEEIQVYKEIVDDTFTIENIGQVSNKVKSKTPPTQLITQSCSPATFAKYFNKVDDITHGQNAAQSSPYHIADSFSLRSWAIVTNDKTLFSLIFDLQMKWTNKLAGKTDSTSVIPSFMQHDFNYAVEHGRVELLAEMIKRGGAGMQLESLVKKSGVKLNEKPKYYQGLSVHGKKRPGWVSAARGEYIQEVSDQSPPLLSAAFKGSLTSVEWFLSNTPSRLYLDFAESYKDDKLIAHLNKQAGGFEKVLGKWLGARQELALHCAVMSNPTPQSLKKVEFLIDAMPESLDKKSVQGYTPLALAMSLHRVDIAKALVKSGANQLVRDKDGANILHLLLVSAINNRTPASNNLQQFLDLIDPRLISSLLIERSSHNPGSLSPLMRYLRTALEDSNSEAVLRILFDFAKPNNNEHLELLDGSGDTPVHFVVASKKLKWLKIMLEYRPDLLYRENSVGRTPYEIAEDSYIAACVAHAPNIIGHQYNYYGSRSITDRKASTFVPGAKDEKQVTAETVFRFCEKFASENPGTRRLVSLLDANEVAKRLAGRKGSAQGEDYWRAGRRLRRGYLRRQVQAQMDDASEAGDEETGEGEEEEREDEVSKWYTLVVYGGEMGGSNDPGFVTQLHSMW